MSVGSSVLSAEMVALREKFSRAKEEMGKVVVGQYLLIERMFIALLADGHLLVEGVPGLAKTLAVNTLSKVISCEFKRIQFTPDLLPADLIGTTIYNPKEGTFSVKKGPIFTNILLADEINRAPAKVQAALLEVMQERQVTMSGETFCAGSPYLVLATQNPIEQEGTYPLPEAQTDRFMMKVIIDYPNREQEKEIMAKWAKVGAKLEPEAVMTGEEVVAAQKTVDQIFVDEKVDEYILDLVFATRDPKSFKVPIEGLLQFGASPRASIALKMCARAFALLEGRAYVIPDDVKQVAHDVLRHRLRRSYEAEAEEVSPDDIIDEILKTLTVP